MVATDKLFLVGLPGSGKTSLGKDLSYILNLQFVDLDSEIEQHVGKKIRAIFSEMGEGRFRDLESSQLLAWCRSPSGFVMATGGGTPCFQTNMELINSAGTSIFLDVPVAEIVARMERTALDERPLLAKSEGLVQKIEKLRADRLTFYQKATITVAGIQLTAEEIVKALTL